LAKLPPSLRTRIADKLAQAKHNPHHFCERLSERTEYKIRVGDYRVIVEIEPHRIKVMLVDHRGRVYERRV
jgi:mRNA interferase RelE/StbE